MSGILLLNLLLPSPLMGEGQTSSGASAEVQSEPLVEEQKSWGIVPLPILGYAPEMGFMFGASCMYWNNPAPAIVGQKPYMLQGAGAYTTKNQYFLALNGEGYTRGNNFYLGLETGLSKFSGSLFYGIGPDTEEDQEEEYTSQELGAKGSFLWQALPRFYLGPTLSISHLSIEETEEGGLLDQGDIDGSDGSTLTGAGLKLVFDTTNNSFYPTRGSILEIETSLYPKSLGTENTFANMYVNYRQYIQLYHFHVLALETYLELAGGTVPFNKLAQLGGSNLLRGYHEGRYRDRAYLAAQAEYRFPLFWRLGGTVFGAVGQVGPSLPELSFSDLKWAVGSGLRFAVTKEERINLRFDFAYSLQGFGFYINFLEAF